MNNQKNAPALTFFNNISGVGKTSLIYHLSWMYAEMGKTVVAVDFDPQSNLTAAFLDDDKISDIWDSQKPGSTVYQCVHPLDKNKDISPPDLIQMSPSLYLLPGDVRLSAFEDTLADNWGKANDDHNLFRPLLILSSFWHVIRNAEKQVDADVVLVDVGPNLGAINRSVLIATDFVLIPLAADLFSLQGLKNLGPTLFNWRNAWKRRKENWSQSDESKEEEYQLFTIPDGNMTPIGYLCQQYGVRLDRPVHAYDKWVNRIPAIYRSDVLNVKEIEDNVTPQNDPYCIATMKHYRSLIPMGQEARKPIFKLSAADGAIGSHSSAVQSAYTDFEKLAKDIEIKINAK